MTSAKIVAMLELIDELVNEELSYQEKRQQVRDIIDDNGHLGTSFLEFISWFETEEE
jgi:hypothetical protein